MLLAKSYNVKCKKNILLIRAVYDFNIVTSLPV